MDMVLQIDNVQDFVGVIGNNDNLWELLLNREVSRFEGKIQYEHTIQDLKGVINSTQGIIIEVNIFLQCSRTEPSSKFFLCW